MPSLSSRATRPGPTPLDMSIEWEFMPSLRNLLKRIPEAHTSPAWADTLPSSFDEPHVSEFEEPLPGLTLREVTEPEVFDAYFGRRAA